MPLTNSFPVPATAPPVCRFEYSIAENTLSYEGMPQGGMATLGACQDACSDREPCVGFDFITVTAAINCFLHNEISFPLRRTEGVVNVNQYTKRPCEGKLAFLDHPLKNYHHILLVISMNLHVSLTFKISVMAATAFRRAEKIKLLYFSTNIY